MALSPPLCLPLLRNISSYICWSSRCSCFPFFQTIGIFHIAALALEDVDKFPLCLLHWLTDTSVLLIKMLNDVGFSIDPGGPQLIQFLPFEQGSPTYFSSISLFAYPVHISHLGCKCVMEEWVKTLFNHLFTLPVIWSWKAIGSFWHACLHVPRHSWHLCWLFTLTCLSFCCLEVVSD